MLKHYISHLNFIKNKPLVVPRIIKGYFKSWILRQEVLRSIDWAFLYECNFRCEMCSQEDFKGRQNEYLTIEQIQKIWKEAKKMGVIHVNITGGEPMLIPQERLLNIIKSLSPRSTMISLVTNGWLVTEKKLRILKKAGLDTIQVSIDSHNPKKHDKIRKAPGSFERCINAVDLARKVGLNVCISTVVSHENLKHLPKMVKMAKDHDSFLLLCTYADVGLGETKYKMTQEDLDKYNEILNNNEHVRSDNQFNYRGGQRCEGGKEAIHINAFGKTFMCPRVFVEYGDLKKHSLHKAMETMWATPELQTHFRDCKQAFSEEFQDYLRKEYAKTAKEKIKKSEKEHEHEKISE